MKNNLIKLSLVFFYSGFILTGCYKSYSKFYEDGENKGIAIFSNTGNNLLTCYVNDKPWRTVDNSTSGYGLNARYEVYINRVVTSSASDTLIFDWEGYYTADRNIPSYITLKVAVAKNFGYQNLSALQGQRLHIDTTNGYFRCYTTGVSFNSPGSNISNYKGAGNIYFHTASFDSIGPREYIGHISGLFDTDFITAKITNGRFDHAIGFRQLVLW